MVKKITKYLKYVVCCALLVSLIVPSYAALSASDGSAFVTKAEFDAALADFNSRLTTFEAGINSKIDSQVTSYLDRNGIWNGKQVDFCLDFNSAGYYYFWNFYTAPYSNNMGSVSYLFTKGDKSTVKEFWNAGGRYTAGSLKIAEKLTKSGLIFVNFLFVPGESSVDINTRITRVKTAAWNMVVQCGIGLIQTYIEETNSGNDVLNSFDPGGCLAWSPFGANVYIHPSTTPPTQANFDIVMPSGLVTLSGFVSKGMPLYFVMGAAALDSSYGKLKNEGSAPKSYALMGLEGSIY